MHRPSNQPGLQRLAGAELRARIVNNFKEASRQHAEIESRIDSLKSFLEEESRRSNGIVDCIDNLFSDSD